MIRLLSILAATLLLSLSSCEEEDNSPSGGGGGGGNTGEVTFSASLNNEAYTATSDLFISGTHTQVSGIHAWGASGLRVGLNSTETIVISINTLDSTDFQVGAVFSSLNPVTAMYCSGTYAIKSNGIQINAFTPEEANLPATCTISSIDTDAQTWSGTFAFEAEGDDGNTYLVTDGEFSNVPYD